MLKERNRSRRDGRAIALGVVGTALVGSLALVAPAQAATQYGCTFSAPTPSISGGQADFTANANCNNSPGSAYTDRRIAIDLMGEDPLGDDWLNGVTRDTWTQKSYSWSFANWACNEDVGTDEIYVRMRVEVWDPGYGWRRGSWITGGIDTGDCI